MGNILPASEPESDALEVAMQHYDYAVQQMHLLRALSQNPRTCVSRAALLQLAEDAALFFSVVPKDAVRLLCCFLGRPTGRVHSPLLFSPLLKFELGHTSNPTRLLCVDHDGNIVLGTGDCVLFVVDRAGRFVRRLPCSALGHGRACVVDSSGRYYVRDTTAGDVLVLNRDGATERIISVEPRRTYALALSPDEGTLYTVHGTVSSYVVATGELLCECAIETDNVSALAVLSTGEIVVIATNALCLFDPAAPRLRAFQSLPISHSQAACTVDGDDNVYVLCDNGHVCSVFSGRDSLRRIGSFSLPRRTRYDKGMAITQEGFLAVCSFNDHFESTLELFSSRPPA